MAALPNIDEKNLLQKLREGDHAAFKHVFLQRYPSLRLFAARFVPDEAEADDLVEEVFVRLWQKGFDFNDYDHLKASLYRQLRNDCLNLLKLRKRAEERNRFFVAESMAHDADYLSAITRTETIAQLHRAISSLPQQMGKVIRYSYLDGLSNQEVADKMGTSLQTVKNQKRKALALLRGILGTQTYLLLLSLEMTEKVLN